MAKKTKETKPKEVKPKKEPKPKAPVDPVKTRNLVRLLNILALLIAIIAFLLQLFAVLGHHWKRQSTSFYPIVSPNNYAPPTVYEDSRLDQTYGLFSREVKLFANNDQLEQLWSSTRFPRLDNGDDALNHCLTRSTSLRGALLSCSDQVISPEQCSCRRHPYWNAVIVFEILALIFLGIVVVLVALQTTHLHGILKPAAAGLALLAFIFLLIGLILILSYLKRETRSLADAYPHIYGRLLEKLTVFYNPNRGQPYYQSALRRALRRQAPETYRVYTLLQGQHPFNETHFQEYSETARAWVYRPYTSLVPAVPYASFSSDSRYPSSEQRNTTTTTATTTVSYNPYGPTLGYDQVFERTKARIGCSTVLSILAMILSLLLPLIVIFSWLKEKALSTDTKTVTTTTVKTEYVPVPQDVPPESVPLNTVIPTEYDPRRPIGEAIITTQNVPHMVYDSYTGRNEPVIVRDVIIRDENPSTYTQQYAIPVRNN